MVVKPHMEYVLVPCVGDHDQRFHLFSKLNEHFLLADIIEANIEPPLSDFLDKVEEHLHGLVPGGELKYLIAEGIIQIEDIHMLGAPLKPVIGLIGRIQIRVVPELLFIEPYIACVEHRAHIALEQDHHGPSTVVRVEQRGCDFEGFVRGQRDLVGLVQL